MRAGQTGQGRAGQGRAGRAGQGRADRVLNRRGARDEVSSPDRVSHIAVVLYWRVLCGVVKCGQVWCGVVWCGVVWYDVNGQRATDNGDDVGGLDFESESGSESEFVLSARSSP